MHNICMRAFNYHEKAPVLACFAKVMDGSGSLIGSAGGEEREVNNGD
jgi:hypothetical protein